MDPTKPVLNIDISLTLLKSYLARLIKTAFLTPSMLNRPLPTPCSWPKSRNPPHTLAKRQPKLLTNPLRILLEKKLPGEMPTRKNPDAPGHLANLAKVPEPAMDMTMINVPKEPSGHAAIGNGGK